MKCPSCSSELEEKKVQNITVDVCSGGCGGIWFDNFELKKVDESHEAAGEELLNTEKSAAIQVDLSKKRSCPRCDNQPMIKHFASVKKEVEVDECPSCGGYWLDDGELGRIRTQFTSEEERREAAKKHFSLLFDGKLNEMSREGEENLEKAKKIAGIFRFICPSCYLPGKEEGGAF
ncbi:MAG: zf-TFIIB domain-containing protein [Deltaproteobacteria bacterium]|nr:zf-TFIIB domain-containing protein [Deltaproteobacteria bacterium]